MKFSVQTRQSRLILAGLALMACSATWASLSQGDSPEVREIKGHVARQAGRIQSIEVSYKLETKSDLKPAQIRALSDFRNQLFLPKDEWTEAFKGEKRYRRQIQPEKVEWLAETDDYGLVPPQDVDPKAPRAVQENQKNMKDQYDRAGAGMKAQEARGVPRRRKEAGVLDLMQRDVTRGFNGRTLWMRRPRTERVNEFQVRPVKKNAHWFGISSYLSGVGLQPADPTSEGNPVQKAQGMFRLADWFKHRTYEVEKTEAIDGSTCVVLRGSLNSLVPTSLLTGELGDRIWLDRDHGWVLRKREMTKSGRVLMRWENAGLREVEPGLWLPTIVRHDRFAEDAPPEWQGKPVVSEEVRVKSIEVNRVPDDRFDFVPEKEDVIEDLRGNL